MQHKTFCDLHNGEISGPRGIETEHLILGTMFNCLRVRMQNIFSNSKIKVLTCGCIWNFYTSKLDQTDCDIHTLRLIDKYLDKSIIETLNLHTSVINLTIKVRTFTGWKNTKWMTKIEKVLLKQDYNNLKNVNIILTRIQSDTVEQLFNMLKKNIDILKHQFNKLNFGLKISCQTTKNNFMHTFELNSQIDSKFLDAKQQELLNWHSNPKRSVKQERNFYKLWNQWS